MTSSHHHQNTNTPCRLVSSSSFPFGLSFGLSFLDNIFIIFIRFDKHFYYSYRKKYVFPSFSFLPPLLTLTNSNLKQQVFAVRNGVVAGVMNWLGGNPLLHDPPLHLPCLRLPLLVLPNFVVDPYTVSLDEPYVQCGGSSFRRAVCPGRRWHDRMQFLTGDQVE